MKQIISMLAANFFFCASAFGGPLTLTYQKELLDNSQEKFEEHLGPADLDFWMAMNVNAARTTNVFEQVKAATGIQLKSRGEAHVTVITPPEYAVLKTHISMEEIDSIAADMQIQDSIVLPVCVGKGDAVLNDKREQTYFIVVKAPALTAIREEIEARFIERGGSPDAFVADHFFPHITLGFTARDLFEADGVTKDERSCVFDIRPALGN